MCVMIYSIGMSKSIQEIMTKKAWGMAYKYEFFGKSEYNDKSLILSIQYVEWDESKDSFITNPTILHLVKPGFKIEVYDKQENLLNEALGTYTGLEETLKTGQNVYIKFFCCVLDSETYTLNLCMIEDQYIMLLDYLKDYKDQKNTDLADMSGAEFELLVQDLVHKMGFETQLTKASGDGGIDIVAYNHQPFLEGKYIIQCKRWNTNSKIGEPTLRDLYGVITSERANKGILVTTSYFTSSAIDFAEDKPIELIDGDKLNSLLKKYSIRFQ